jgi:hypothetical protein
MFGAGLADEESIRVVVPMYMLLDGGLVWQIEVKNLFLANGCSVLKASSRRIPHLWKKNPRFVHQIMAALVCRPSLGNIILGVAHQLVDPVHGLGGGCMVPPDG